MKKGKYWKYQRWGCLTGAISSLVMWYTSLWWLSAILFLATLCLITLIPFISYSKEFGKDKNVVDKNK